MAALLGADINDAAIAIAIVFVPSFVRLLRGEVIAVREEAYIESARSLGATSKTAPRAPCAAQRRLAHHHPAGAGPRLRPPDRGRPQLPRHRRAAAHAQLGRDAPGGISVHQLGSLGPHLPGHRHHAHRAGVQPGGRRAAGLAGSGATVGRATAGRRGGAGPSLAAPGPARAEDQRRAEQPGCPRRVRAEACAARGRGPADRVPHHGEWLPVMEDATFSRRPGRDARPGRRERLGQDCLGAGRHGSPAGQGLPGDRARSASSGRELTTPQPGRPAQAPRATRSR